MSRACIPDNEESPLAYAARLAKYISDPSTIRVRTLDHWGRAPSVTECAGLRKAAMREREVFLQASENRTKVSPDRDTGDTFICGHERDADNTVPIGNRDECRTCLAKKQDAVRACYAREKARAWRQVDEPSREASVAAVVALPPAQTSDSITHPIRRIIVRASELTGIPAADIVSSKRPRNIVSARWAVMHVLRGRGLSLPRICAGVGLKDHTSAIYALDQIEGRRRHDEEFDWLCGELEAFSAIKPAPLPASVTAPYMQVAA